MCVIVVVVRGTVPLTERNGTMEDYKYASAAESDHFEYLDDLRVSGVTNMFAATPFLQAKFDLAVCEAGEILGKWMKTFEARGCPGAKE